MGQQAILWVLEMKGVFLGEMQTFLAFQRKDRKQQTILPGRHWAQLPTSEGASGVVCVPPPWPWTYPDETQGTTECNEFPLSGDAELATVFLGRLNGLICRNHFGEVTGVY